VPRHIQLSRLGHYLDLRTAIMLGKSDVEHRGAGGKLSEALVGPLAPGGLVIDKTGLTGRFDFTRERAQERKAPADGDVPMASDPVGPTPLEALRDQLGLRLEPSKAALPVPVIDKVVRPSAN
jgi:uncharacterized protein (TIGR03435 family)